MIKNKSVRFQNKTDFWKAIIFRSADLWKGQHKLMLLWYHTVLKCNEYLPSALRSTLKIFISFKCHCYSSLVAQTVKNLPAMQETWVLSLGWEDDLEKEMATHSWEIPWTEEPGGLQSMGSQRVRHSWTTEHTHTHTHTHTHIIKI